MSDSCSWQSTESNSSKTFYKKDILHELTTEECFGNFWDDIFSLKIKTKKDDEERIKKRENLKSHLSVNGFEADEKFKPKRLEDSGNYLRKVLLFNATPKVNLVG